MEKGIHLIAVERQEQIKKHGHSIKEDAEQNNKGQLINGALSLLTSRNDLMPKSWTPEAVKKIQKKSEIEKLIIAGAFIAAEIDRLQYKKI